MLSASEAGIGWPLDESYRNEVLYDDRVDLIDIETSVFLYLRIQTHCGIPMSTSSMDLLAITQANHFGIR